MPILCDLWPMNLLTKPIGEKDRRLIIHPKEAVLRNGIRRDSEGRLEIVDPKAIKIPDGIYCIEDKEQGHRHIWCCDKEGNYHLYGRRLNVQQTYTDILPKLNGKVTCFPPLPPESALDFELCWPGHPDSEVTTAIKDHPEELHPYFFAILIWKGSLVIGDNSFEWFSGRRHLEHHVGKKYMTKGYKPINLDSSTKAGKQKKLWVLETLLNKAEEKGKEGFVLKEMMSMGWWKLKGINEADVFVTGFKISDSETLKGLATGVKIAVYKDGKVFNMGNVSGFDRETQTDMAKNPDKYLGRVLRVVYQEIAGKGKMKHGFKDSWRDDKNKESCTFDQFGG